MRRLYRSRRQAIIGGVCAGIADYFQADPTIVRLVWAATILLGGTGVVAYILAWLIIPPEYVDEFGRYRPKEEGFEPRTPAEPRIAGEPSASGVPSEGIAGEDPQGEPEAAPDAGVEPTGYPTHTAQDRRSGRSGPSVLGLILIVLGAFLLVRNLVPQLHLQRYWPLAVVALGLWLIVSAVRGER